jgi:hypothetical protein
MRALVVGLVMAVLAGCGGGDGQTTSEAATTTSPAKADDPLVRVALAAVQATDPTQCRRFYAGSKAVDLCEDYVAAGSLQAQAQPRTVERSGAKAVVTLAEAGGDPVALLVRQSRGRWRVYDSPNLLPTAD